MIPTLQLGQMLRPIRRPFADGGVNFLLRQGGTTALKTTDPTTWSTGSVTGAWVGGGLNFWSRGDKLFVTTGAGAGYTSHDNGATWTAWTGLPAINVHDIVHVPAFGAYPERWLAAMASGPAMGTTTNGHTWGTVAVEDRTYYAGAANNGVVVVGSTVYTAIRSTDGGATFGASYYIGV